MNQPDILPNISKRKKVLFSVLPSLFLLVFLALAEFSLRWFWPSLSRPFVVPTVVGGVELLQINRRYLSKYFPPSVPLLPELKPSLLQKQKQKNTFRIVCLGESSMFGTPYQMTANIPGILRKQLRHLYPDHDFEVLNLGASAINSNVIADLAKQVVGINPDLVLLYVGHNEFYGPDGVGASFFEKHLPWLTALKYSTKELSLISLLERILVPKKEEIPHEYNLMRQVSQEFKVSLISSDAERIFKVYESNLRKIIALLRENHMPLIVSDVTSNLLFPPFAADEPPTVPNLADELKSAEALEAQVKTKEALEKFFRIRSMDTTNAGINFAVGGIKFKQKDIAATRYYLTLAKDNDLLKFRAPERTNEITRSVCRNLNVPIISSDSLFTSISTAGIPGNDLFWEHLHPTARGYYEIANLYLKKIIDLGFIGGEPGPPNATTLLPFHFDSLGIAWLDLAYADLSMKNLTSQWPFEHYEVRPVVLGEKTDSLTAELAVQVYRLRIGWEEGCLKTAFRFQALGLPRLAAATYQALVDENPYDFYSHYLLGNVIKNLGEPEKAIGHYRESLKLKPDYVFTRIDLGLLEVNEGRFDEAIELLSSALRLLPSSQPATVRATILYGLSAAYANKGEFDKSLRAIDESVALAPAYEPARKLKSDLERHRASTTP